MQQPQQYARPQCTLPPLQLRQPAVRCERGQQADSCRACAVHGEAQNRRVVARGSASIQGAAQRSSACTSRRATVLGAACLEPPLHRSCLPQTSAALRPHASKIPAAVARHAGAGDGRKPLPPAGTKMARATSSRRRPACMARAARSSWLGQTGGTTSGKAATLHTSSAAAAATASESKQK